MKWPKLNVREEITKFEMKNTLGRIDRRFDIAEEMIHYLEDVGI